MPYLELLRNHIDITKLHFSDVRSRLLMFRTPGQSRLFIKLAECLPDPEEFWGEFPVPTLARNDPYYDADSMRRGLVWVDISYIFG